MALWLRGLPGLILLSVHTNDFDARGGSQFLYAFGRNTTLCFIFTATGGSAGLTPSSIFPLLPPLFPSCRLLRTMKSLPASTLGNAHPTLVFLDHVMF